MCAVEVRWYPSHLDSKNGPFSDLPTHERRSGGAVRVRDEYRGLRTVSDTGDDVKREEKQSREPVFSRS